MSGITLNDETRLILQLGIAFRIQVAEEQTGTTDTFNIVCIKNIICRQLNSPFFL